jgi:hypothetical protein
MISRRTRPIGNDFFEGRIDRVRLMIKSLPVGLILRLNVFSLFHDSTHQTGCSTGHRNFEFLAEKNDKS